MALVTGTAFGTITAQEEIYLEGAPTIFLQDYNAPEHFSPDANGFYWQLTGTSTYNVYQIGCVNNVSLTENLTMNDVLCDDVGVKDTVQQRNYVEFSFNILSFFPLSVLRILLNTGVVTKAAPKEYTGIGKINNDQFWHCYAPKVYNEDVGDYIWIMLHKCKLVDAWTINMNFGTPWQATGVKLRAFTDSTKPAAQSFGSFGRSDLSAVV